MIQYIWIFLLFGSSYVSIMDSVYSLSNVTQMTTSIDNIQDKRLTTGYQHTNRGARDARLLKGETMGGLRNCTSFEIGDKIKQEFYSPNYPEIYPSKAECTRRIEAKPNELVILDFRDQFSVEPSENCKYDYLEVRDGAYGYSPELGRFCGSEFPPYLKSSGPALWLKFTSDDSIEYHGFRAVYSFETRKDIASDTSIERCIVNKTEEEEMTKDEKKRFVVSNEDIPEEFLNKSNKTGIDCLFNLYVGVDKKVSLTWDTFDLKFPNDCDANYVHVLNEGTDTIKKTYCGAAAETVIYESNLMSIQYVVKKNAINSTFKARFTPFRRAKECNENEFNCQDGSCIHADFECDEISNCLTASDEDQEECKKRKEDSFWKQATKTEMLIILIVFFFILFGMCCTLIFNIAKKLIHDFSVIKEQVNQSRESQLDQLGRKTPTATLLTPMVTILPNLPDNLVNVTEITAHINIRESIKEEEEGEEDHNCYVPTEHSFPNLIRKELGFERINGGPEYHHRTCQARRESGRIDGDEEEDGLVTHNSDSVSYMPEMRDNECQTRESLFYNTSSTSDSTTANKSTSLSPSPPPPCTMRRSHIKPTGNAPVVQPATAPPIGFTTFGYKNNQKPDKTNKHSKEHKFRAEAVIEMERFKSPKHETSSTDSRPSRPYSVQSTKSAPDVIVTH